MVFLKPGKYILNEKKNRDLASENRGKKADTRRSNNQEKTLMLGRILVAKLFTSLVKIINPCYCHGSFGDAGFFVLLVSAFFPRFSEAKSRFFFLV